ncbi:MAG TPA: DUF5686 family protein [Candidatus Kapabacteria bacterium]|nr:DUF5686 family protein [Candidatus Kapabacteria bacterium]
MQRLLPTALVLLLASLACAHAQGTIAAEGSVTDAATGSPIGGAVVRLQQRNARTYTSGSGRFRIPLAAGLQQLTVSSIGYTDTTISVDAVQGMAPIAVRLHASAIRMQGVEVNAGLSADQIIQRTIERRDENRRRAKTVQGLLYSKMAFDIDGNAFGKIKDEDRHAILETFSRAYYSDKGPRLVVIQRRQTRNIPAQSNLLAIGDFVSFYDDDLQLLNVNVPSPLNPSTLSRYRFTLLDRKQINNDIVYVIGVKAATRLFPAFEGTMTIVAQNYNLIAVDLRPSGTTAIPFVSDLRLEQKFDRVKDDIWQPTYLNISGRGRVELVKGFAEVGASINATSIFTELQVNAPIPDSVYADRRIVTAAPAADSARPEFWEGNDLSELTPQEKETYHLIDSTVAATPNDFGEREGGDVSFDGPSIDFNRAGSVTLGLNASASIGPLAAKATAAYSFGLRRPVGTLTGTLRLLSGDGMPTLHLRGSLFSAITTNAYDRGYPRIINTIVAALFHRDYFDYYRSDGFSGGLDAESGGMRLGAGVEMARHFTLPVATNRSIFSNEAFRTNPAVIDGSYRTATITLGLGEREDAITITSNPAWEFGFSAAGIYGEQTETGTAFRLAHGSFRIAIPTIPTGYTPMLLNINVDAGSGSANLPVEYQFRMPTSNGPIGAFSSFYSAPTGVYGGTRYLALAGEQTLSDIIWRALDLPTVDGRGIEFSVSGAAGIFENANPTGYSSTHGIWYTELGAGIGHIPTFISNVFYLELEGRWGIGPLGAGNFGAVLKLSGPF